MTLSAIVAISKNRAIGKDNQIPWYLPNDLKWFKKNTMYRHIIMGRNTWESLGRLLPKREHVVITRDMFYAATGCLIAHSIQEAIDLAELNGEQEAFIIGGGKIYEQTHAQWDKLYLTEVDLECEGDVFFPELNLDEWKTTFEETHEPDERNKCRYTFKILERIR